MAVLAAPADDVVGPLERDREVPVLLFDLVLGDRGRAVVRDRGSLDEDVSVRKGFLHRVEHIKRGDDGDHLNEGNRIKGHLARDEGYVGAPKHRAAGDCVAHLARAVVR